LLAIDRAVPRIFVMSQEARMRKRREESEEQVEEIEGVVVRA
jgi:hypothetical protein